MGHVKSMDSVVDIMSFSGMNTELDKISDYFITLYRSILRIC